MSSATVDGYRSDSFFNKKLSLFSFIESNKE